MLPRSLLSVLTVGTLGLALAAGSAVGAPSKKPAPAAKKKPSGPLAPAKDAPTATPATPAKPAAPPIADPGGPLPGPTTTPTTPSTTPPATGGTGGGAVVEMSEDNTPPADVNGTDENPDAPRIPDEDGGPAVPAKAARPAGYPVEEIYRPLTLPRNMSEVALSPHLTVNPLNSNAELRARYGVTRQWQLGLTYDIGGVYKKPTPTGKTGFNAGKAVGPDVTVLVQNFIAIKVGLPIYLDPVAVGLTLAAPIKFTFFDKLAIGGLDDLLEIRLHKFMPSFGSQLENDVNAGYIANNTVTSKGALRFSGYVTYQYEPRLALFGRLSVINRNFDSIQNDVLLVGGLQYSPRRYVDVGASVGWQDLTVPSQTFGLNLFAALRI
jgi:hypothetical protein